MHALYGLILLSGAYPLWRAWRGNQRTTLLQAVNWAAAGWVAWLGAVALGGPDSGPDQCATARYLALCLTGCAGVAVLGARRPGVGAWNFVLLGLLAVMLLPLLQRALLGGQALDAARVLFLAAVLGVGLLNYLPTRLAPGVLLLAMGCGWEVLLLAGQMVSSSGGLVEPGWLCLGLAPWVGLLSWRAAPPPPSEFDRVWLDFRNRFGAVWGLRLREQFNNAAANAGWPVVLSWQGLVRLAGDVPLGVEEQEAIEGTLRALLRRFGMEEGQPGSPAPPGEAEDMRDGAR